MRTEILTKSKISQFNIKPQWLIALRLSGITEQFVRATGIRKEQSDIYIKQDSYKLWRDKKKKKNNLFSLRTKKK